MSKGNKSAARIAFEKISKEDLSELVKNHNSYRGLSRSLLTKCGKLDAKFIKNYLKQLGLDVSHFTKSFPGSSKYSTHIGKKFGKLTILKIESKNKNLQSLYYAECLCDCGKTHECLMTSLTKGLTRSCGCLRKEITKKGDRSPGWKGYKELTSRLFHSIKGGAALRGLSFEITREEMFDLFIEQDRKCALSGLDIDFGIIDDGSTRTASLDRIDNNKGYLLDNVQWVHRTFNFMRGQLSIEDFMEACTIVVKHNKKRSKKSNTRNSTKIGKWRNK